MKQMIVICVADGIVKIVDGRKVSSFDIPAENLGGELLTRLQSMDSAGRPVAILLGREWFLSTTLEGANSISDELRFQLEDELPIEAEDMAIGLAAGRPGKDRRLVFAASRSRLGWIRELLANDIRVRWVAPLAVMAMEHFASSQRGIGDHTFVWMGTAGSECFVYRQGKLAAWQSRSSSMTLSAQLATLDAPGKRTLLRAESSPEWDEELERHFESTTFADLETLARESAESALRKNLRSEINLFSQLSENRGEVAGFSSASWVLCGLIVLGFSLAAVFWIAAQKQVANRQASVDRFAAAFDERFPDEKSGRMRRRHGTLKSLQRKIEQLETDCQWAEGQRNGVAIRQNLTRYLLDLPEPGEGSERRFRLNRIAVFKDRVETEFELSATTDPIWFQDQMQDWSIELPTRERSTGQRRFRMIFRRKANASSMNSQKKEVSP